jgi:glycosyltransferase involved in cell wall biosynthesis
MRRKVLLFFEYGTLNGGEFSLLSMLEAGGHGDLEFVAAAPPSGRLQARLAQGGIDVVPLILRDDQGQKRPPADIHTHLLDCVARVAPDLVHANSLAMGRMVGRLAGDLAIPCTAHLRDIIKLNKTAIADLNRNTGLIAVSQATKRFHIAQGMQADRVQVITNGVDTNRFCPVPANGTLKRELGLGDHSRLIGQIGQICLRKGQTLLARAAVTLAREFPEVHTLIVGERHSQKRESIDYENTLRQTFRAAGIADRLHCLGFRDDIPALLNEIDLLVHPAHQEPLGRVLLEAAACARPIVATNVGGTPEILAHGVSALLVAPGDTDALTCAIQRLLHDPELRTRLGNQARTCVKEKFALPRATARVRAFWESFL